MPMVARASLYVMDKSGNTRTNSHRWIATSARALPSNCILTCSVVESASALPSYYFHVWYTCCIITSASALPSNSFLTCSVVESGASDGVDFIEENDAGLFGSRHLEQLTHHSRPFAYVLLNQLGTDHANEARVCEKKKCNGRSDGTSI